MLLLRGLVLVASSLCSLAVAQDVSYPQSAKLSYEILGQKSSVNPLATVLYNPATLKYTLSSWTPPSTDNLQSTSVEPESTQLVRVSLPDGSASITSLGAFDPSLSQFIDLWLSSEGSIFAASLTSSVPPPLTDEELRQKRKEERARARGKPIPEKPIPKNKKARKEAEEAAAKKPSVKVNLIASTEGVKPKLNTRKPPVVDESGREVSQEGEPEKTFFQKYWWVFLAGTALMLATGGGEK